MKIDFQFMLRMCIAISLTGLLSGCATLYPKDRMEGSSTDYNMLVETVQNRMLLLNIVRASMRRPMYFTSFNQLSGSLEYNYSSGGLHLPFGTFKGGNDIFSITPSVSYSTKPSFMVNVLDNAEFTSAVMNPVSMDAAYFYLKQGWHKEELWHLLIKSIETETPKHKYINSPADQKQFEEGFQHNLREEFLKYDLVQERREQSEKDKPDEMSKSECLFNCDGKALSIRKADASDKDKQDENSKQDEKDKSKYHFEYGEKSLTVTKLDTAGGYELRDKNKKDKDNKDELLYTIYLRSPEAMLYYLGEILRAEAQKGFTPTIKLRNCDEKPTKLFVARKAGNNDKAAPAVFVDYENHKYIIPGDPLTDSDVRCPLDSSMHVLSFISQLMQLQKSAKDLPATNIFNVIGR